MHDYASITTILERKKIKMLYKLERNYQQDRFVYINKYLSPETSETSRNIGTT